MTSPKRRQLDRQIESEAISNAKLGARRSVTKCTSARFLYSRRGPLRGRGRRVHSLKTKKSKKIRQAGPPTVSGPPQRDSLLVIAPPVAAGEHETDRCLIPRLTLLVPLHLNPSVICRPSSRLPNRLACSEARRRALLSCGTNPVRLPQICRRAGHGAARVSG